MAQENPLAKKPHPSFDAPRRICLSVVALACLLPSLARAQTNYGPNILPSGNFESVTPTYVPWAGVDALGNIHGLEGRQLAVGDSGGVGAFDFAPGIAVCDLNGDGKPDIVLADTRGYFWFFPNSGTPQKPVFTQGEVIPIWLGEEATPNTGDVIENYIPRIQLIDLDNSKHFDVLVGTYSGKLYHIRNIGSATQPNFKPTHNHDTLLINTRKKGVLWCNYLSPFMTNLFGPLNSLNAGLDLIMGDGTYSANSIFLLRNTGSNSEPSFDEEHTQKIIPGMGLEQLTPAVVDWNNDGKADIICGDRTGDLNLFLNTSTDPEHPTFAPATHIKIAGQERMGAFITVAVCDLTGNHLPNLLIGQNNGTILYALNTGKLGAPEFTTPATPIKGVLPPNYHYVSSNDWHKGGAWGAPDELLACVNPQIEPGFTFPLGEKSKYALKFSVWPVDNVYFSERYYPPVEDYNYEHVIGCAQWFTLKLNKTYRLHFWIKEADRNVADLRYKLTAGWSDREGFHGYTIERPVHSSTGWTEETDDVRIENPDDKTVTSWGYGFELRFKGQATIYIDDVQIQEELN